MSDDITIENVTYTYRGETRPALRNVTLHVKPGELVLVTGPAGAGKTTLCSCLNGLIPHFYTGTLEGNVNVRGFDTRIAGTATLSEKVGMLFQDPSSQLLSATVEDDIAFGAENYGVPPAEIRKRVDETIRLLRLQNVRDKSPHNLSGGQQQAVALGSILAMRPDVYVLDEPTSNLDPLGSAQVLQTISDLARLEHKTIIIVEHKLEELVADVDRMVVMDEGSIKYQGTPREVLNEAEAIEAIGLKPPQVSLLFAKLRDRLKQPTIPITLSEATMTLTAFLKNNGNSAGILTAKRVSTEAEKLPPHQNDVVVEVKDLTFQYPYTKGQALRNVNLTIKHGENIGIIGQNGSGKTTLVKHFIGLLKPTNGSVTVFGMDTKVHTVPQLAVRVGFVFQDPDQQLFSHKVSIEVAFGPKNLGLPEDEIKRRVEKSLKDVECYHLLNENPLDLSKGEKQRINIASVLAMDPQLLVIDEPTTGQDFLRGKEIMDLAMNLLRKGTTLITISHDMNIVAEYCSRTLVMKDGEIFADGATRAIFSDPKRLVQTNLRPPQVTSLAQTLSSFGFPNDVLTVEEMAGLIQGAIGGEQ
jgi:energy-coupling factor transporter ATP-binding protein EcfA2